MRPHVGLQCAGSGVRFAADSAKIGFGRAHRIRLVTGRTAARWQLVGLAVLDQRRGAARSEALPIGRAVGD